MSQVQDIFHERTDPYSYIHVDGVKGGEIGLWRS